MGGRLVFAPSLPISHDNTLTYSNSSTSENLNKGYHSRTQYLPMHLGTGLSMATERWVLTADYNYLDWSRNSSSYTSMKYENQHKVNIGGSYITKPRLARSTELMGRNRVSATPYIQSERREDAVSGSQCRGELPHPVLLSFAGRHLAETTEHTQQSDAGKPIQPESDLTFGERISRAKLK